MSSYVFIWKNDLIQIPFCKGEKAPDLLPIGLESENGRQGQEIYGPHNSRGKESIENITSSSSAPGLTIGAVQSSLDSNCVKLQSGSDFAPPAKLRKLNGERSDPKKYATCYFCYLYLLFS